MRALIAHDDGQLRRLESAIAAIEARSPADRGRMHLLLAALESEKLELLRSGIRPVRRVRTVLT